MMNEKELFKALHGTNIGKALVEHLKKLESEIFDSRNWEDGFDKKCAALAAKPLQKLINNVIIQQERKDVNIDRCE